MSLKATAKDLFIGGHRGTDYSPAGSEMKVSAHAR
jgi:hypothetical protein